LPEKSLQAILFLKRDGTYRIMILEVLAQPKSPVGRCEASAKIISYL